MGNIGGGVPQENPIDMASFRKEIDDLIAERKDGPLTPEMHEQGGRNMANILEVETKDLNETAAKMWKGISDQKKKLITLHLESKGFYTLRERFCKNLCAKRPFCKR